MRLVAPYRARQSWTGFHALVEAFYVSRAAFLAQRLRRLHRGVRKRGVGGKPESNVQRERLVGQVEVPCEAVELTGNSIKTPPHRRFESTGAVGRHIRRPRRPEDFGARAVPGPRGSAVLADQRGRPATVVFFASCHHSSIPSSGPCPAFRTVRPINTPAS